MKDVVWESAVSPNLKYAVIYGPVPRWKWCKHLPKSWAWFYPIRLIAYYPGEV